MSSDLVSRLLAAIEETEQIARDCAGAPWVDNVPGVVHVDPAAIRDSKWSLGHLGYVASADNSPIGDAYRKHIAYNDPAAVLRRCAADRELVEWCEGWQKTFRGPIPEGHSEESALHFRMAAEYIITRLEASYGISVEEETTGE